MLICSSCIYILMLFRWICYKTWWNGQDVEVTVACLKHHSKLFMDHLRNRQNILRQLIYRSKYNSRHLEYKTGFLTIVWLFSLEMIGRAIQLITVFRIHTVTDFFKALLGNGSINTTRYAPTTIGRMLQLIARQQLASQWTSWSGEVFSLGLARAPMDWLDTEHVTCVFCA
jgi:hypothetical protein